MAEETIKFAISPDGVTTYIYDDALVDLVEAGKSTITRASHVEPHPDGGWIADMGPMGGPILGPAPLRSLALELERGWLESKLF